MGGRKEAVVTPWKEHGCTLMVEVDNLSDRETASQEINEKFGGGGALNANYQTVEAIAKLSNILGLGRFQYGTDFIFKTASFGEVILDFDNAHRLKEGCRLVLGGVSIEFEKGLEGYSDADVLSHAVADAILGAAGLGDIGVWFPDTKEKYKDISSLIILKEVSNILFKTTSIPFVPIPKGGGRYCILCSSFMVSSRINTLPPVNIRSR